MNIEFEIAFPNTNHETIIEKIKTLWGNCKKKKTFMRRVIFFHPTDPCGYLRIRDEWGKITTTYKYIPDWELSIESIKELECTVSDFETMKNIYIAMWLREKAYQETRREVWEISWEIEIMLDEWPWLNPFIEIEWKTEEKVRKYVGLLWLKYWDGIFWTVDQLYLRELSIPVDIINNHTPKLTFDNPPQVYVPSHLPQ